ncbi:MAG: pantetheine-phosphate adenylyltransferase [Pseudomonadota bacterium]
MAKERIGLYPGTFDPLTYGHIDIVTRAVKLVDHLIVGVANNSSKGPLFSVDERVDMTKKEMARIKKESGVKISVTSFDILLMHYAEEINANIIVRGLRAVSDFEYEFQMVGMNNALNPDIETVFLMADAQHQAVASRLVKEIARLNGDVSQFVTPTIEKLLQQKLS